MNYFAHGVRFTDRPYFLAGTAVPDWLSVADRKVRLTTRRVTPFADQSKTIQAELAAGVLQHLADDQWFHGTPAFYKTSGVLARMFREHLGADEGYRPGFLGHVATEMILDGILIEHDPRRLDAYYDAIGRLDAEQIENAVNQMARHSTGQLSALIPRFLREEFLRDYLDSERLLFRLNQLLRRIRLRQLPDDAVQLLRKGRTIVASSSRELLPDECF
jgi:hypothetical protein